MESDKTDGQRPSWEIYVNLCRLSGATDTIEYQAMSLEYEAAVKREQEASRAQF